MLIFSTTVTPPTEIYTLSLHDALPIFRDPGPDAVLGNGDDGPGIPGFNLSAAALPLPVRNLFTNLPGDAEYQRSEEHTSELQSLAYLVCRLLLEKKK